ncbi:hypothetical protein PG995_005189 [Apiospora arundinis]
MPRGIFSPACSQYSQPRHSSSISAYIPPRHLFPPQPTYSGPVRASNKLRHKPLAPQNADEDPYTLAVMIALAQRPGADGAKVEVRVVTTPTQKNGHILHLRPLHYTLKPPCIQGGTSASHDNKHPARYQANAHDPRRFDHDDRTYSRAS